MSPEFALALFVPLSATALGAVVADLLLKDGLVDFFERLLGRE